MQLVSLIWGVLAIVGMLVGFIPCLGWLNWANIPFAVVGLIIGIVASANARIGERGTATIGIVLNAVAVVFGLMRLMIGGFVL